MGPCGVKNMTQLSELHPLNFNPTTLSKSGENVKFAAEANFCNVLADKLSILNVERLSIEVRAVRWQKQGLKVSGLINANLSQECVSTLEPVEELIDISFERRFMPEGDWARKYERLHEGELVIDPDDNDEPDEMPIGGIDLWETIIEEINLALDPFPRSADLELDTNISSSQVEFSEENEPTHRPFADLNALINEKNSKN